MHDCERRNPPIATWLLKTEPGDYAFGDLVRDRRTCWAGVTNPQAVAHLRAVTKGDLAWVYHTGDEKAIVGLARVITGGYADPDRPALTASGDIKFAVIDIEPVAPAKSPWSLSDMRASPAFKGFALLTNSRLSVIPVPPAVDNAIRTRTGLG